MRVYCGQLLERFRNAALPHRTRQIAMDGSQKLPQRLLGTMRDRLAAGAPVAHLTLAVAGWIRYASGSDERGGRIDVQDPLADDVPRQSCATRAAIRARSPTAFSTSRACSAHDLVAHYAFREAVRGHVIALFRDGAQVTLARHLGVA